MSCRCHTRMRPLFTLAHGFGKSFVRISLWMPCFVYTHRATKSATPSSCTLVGQLSIKTRARLNRSPSLLETHALDGEHKNRRAQLMAETVGGSSVAHSNRALIRGPWGHGAHVPRFAMTNRAKGQIPGAPAPDPGQQNLKPDATFVACQLLENISLFRIRAYMLRIRDIFERALSPVVSRSWRYTPCLWSYTVNFKNRLPEYVDRYELSRLRCVPSSSASRPDHANHDSAFQLAGHRRVGRPDF
jgi:hypothetical protein